MKSQLIVLDVDDTLYLERDYVRSGFQAVSEYVEGEFGFSEFYDLAWTAFLEGRRRTIFDEVLNHFPPRIEVEPSIADLVSVYRNHKPDIALCPDAKVFLNEAGEDYRLAVVTDGPAASQRNKVEALKLDRWVSEFVVTDEHGPAWPKPSLLPFQRLEEVFGAYGSNCVYIADNPNKDFVGPVELGWRTVRISRPLGLHCEAPDLENSRAEVKFNDLTGVLEVLW